MLYFHSDGSVEDWVSTSSLIQINYLPSILQGYKIIMTANYPLNLSTQNRSNWLFKLSLEIQRCLSVVAMELIDGPGWNEDLENSYNSWMENSLVKPEYFHYQTEVETDHDQFLFDFVERPENSLAEAFIRAMKSEVPEDQGSIESVNKAVYATCAAILRVNGLTAEALSFIQGSRDKPSPTLLKAWKAGQKMRSYFSLSDLKASLSNDTRRGRNKKPSLYAGADEEVIDMASKAIVSRAKFLLRVPIMESAASGFSDTNEREVSEEGKIPDQEILSQQTSSEDKRKTGLNSSNRWQLAARAVHLKRQVSHETRNVSEIWQSLVSETVALDKLKNVFQHRRRFTERTRAGKNLTLTERVLQFVQSDVEVGKLHEMNALRNKRAISRAKGIDILYRLLSGPQSAFGLIVVSDAFSFSLRKLRNRGQGTIHYSNGLGGCSQQQLNMLYEKVSSYLKKCVDAIKLATDQLRTKAQIREYSQQEQSWESALICAVRSFALDYDISDHSIILESGILDWLQSIFKFEISSSLRDLASSIFHLLVAKFLSVDQISNSPDYDSLPNDIIKRLLSLMSDLLNHSVESLVTNGDEFLDLQVVRSQFDSLSSQIQSGKLWQMNSFTNGISCNHSELSLSHTVSFALKRRFSSSLDRLLEKSELVGKFVIRGPDWNDDDSKRSDGGLGTTGIITQISLDDGKVKVRWNNSVKDAEYTFDFPYYSRKVRDGKVKGEVVLADPLVGGYIFSKGSSEIGYNFEKRSALPIVSHISAQLLPDTSLLVIYHHFQTTQAMMIRSTSRISCDDYSHIVVTIDMAGRGRLFVNGELESTGILFQPANFQNFESDHPINFSNFEDKKIFKYPGEELEQGLVLDFEEQSTLGSRSLVIENEKLDWVRRINNFSAANPAILVPFATFLYSVVGDEQDSKDQVLLVFHLNLVFLLSPLIVWL